MSVKHFEVTRKIVYGLLDETLELIEKKNKALKRRGVDYNIQTKYDLSKIEKFSSKKIPCIELTVSFDVPTLESFEFLGIIDKERNTISFGEDTALQNFVDKSGKYFSGSYFVCPVCGKKTLRTKSFVVKKIDGDGEIKIGTTGKTFKMNDGEISEIGSTCFKLIGGNEKSLLDMVDFGSLWKMLDEISPENENFDGECLSRSEMMFEIDEVVDVAFELINRFGFVPSSAEDETKVSTKNELKEVLLGGKYAVIDLRDVNFKEENHKKIKEIVLEMVKEKYDNYSFKLNQLANSISNKAGNLYWVKLSDFGFIAAMVNGYFKYLRKKEEELRELEEKIPSVKFDGVIGSLIKGADIEVTLDEDITSSITDFGYYGTVQYDIVMRDKENHVFVYTGGSLPKFLENEDGYAKKGSKFILNQFKVKGIREMFWTHKGQRSIPHKNVINSKVINIKTSPCGEIIF